MGDGEKSKLSAGSEGKQIWSRSVRSSLGNGQHNFGLGFRAAGSSLITTESQLRRRETYGMLKGAAVVIGAGLVIAASIWYGKNLGEGIMKQQKAGIETRDVRIDALEKQLERELKSAAQQFETMEENLIELPKLGKKNKWPKYEALLKATTENATQQKTELQQRLGEAAQQRSSFHQGSEGSQASK